MENSKIIEIVEKKFSSYQRAKDYYTKTQRGELPKDTEEMLQFFSQLLHILQTLPKEIAQLKKEKEKFENVLNKYFSRIGGKLEGIRFSQIFALEKRTEKAEQALANIRGKDGLVCPRCGVIFHDEDMEKNPALYWTCPTCFAIQHQKCRGSLK